MNQTTFMRGRYIAENFLATREILHHIHGSGDPVIFMKIDFSKAFDSVSWDFLMNTMRARGFPEKWIEWIRTLLTSSSRVLLNGKGLGFFSHKKGLR
jgi:Reverse transcriptase (RNA-dependent DNA polymerase)